MAPRGTSGQPNDGEETQTNDHASKRRRAQSSDIAVGDVVLLKDRHPGSKFRLPFGPHPWTVAERKGTMVTVARGQEKVTRNVSHMKRFFLAPGGELPRGIHTENEEEEEPVPELGASSPCETGARPAVERENEQGNNETDQQLQARPTDRGSQSHYHLRNNPTPSSRLRDYVLQCGGARSGGQ